MKNLIFATAIFIATGVLHASPIQEQVDTPELRKAAGIELKCEIISPERGTASFEITWTPDAKAYKSKDPLIRPRMDLEKDESGLSGEGLQVIYRMEPDGKCRATFMIGIFEAKKYSMFFRLSGQTEYFLPLSDALDELKATAVTK